LSSQVGIIIMIEMVCSDAVIFSLDIVSQVRTMLILYVDTTEAKLL
jgi:hypothetical protein